MIIECPQCGFSGRVPERAILAPHQARCPKCRSRFQLVEPEIRNSGLADLRHDMPRPRLDPSDSNYELNPLGDEFATVQDSWGEPWSDDALPSSPLPVAARPSPPTSVRTLPAWIFRPYVWRVRLFQAWAVLLLAAAMLIALRTMIAAYSFDDSRFFSNELLRPVASVVLLVCASAFLCLYVDVSRKLGRSTYNASPPRVVNPPRPSPPPR